MLIYGVSYHQCLLDKFQEESSETGINRRYKNSCLPLKKGYFGLLKPHRTVLINNKTTLLILLLYLRAFTCKSAPKDCVSHTMPSFLYSSCSSTNMKLLKNCCSRSLVKLIAICSKPLYSKVSKPAMSKTPVEI